MLDFYRKALLAFVGLVIFSLLTGYISLARTFLLGPLLPAEKSAFMWKVYRDTDVYVGGASIVKINDNRFSLNFDLNLSSKASYPFAGVNMVFVRPDDTPMHVNLGAYQTLSFSVKCVPANVLQFALAVVDDKITQQDDWLTYPSPTTYFSCNEHWSDINIDLTRLEIPQWWLDRFKLALSDQDYALNKVARFVIGTSFQSPLDTEANIQVEEIALHGRDWHQLYGSCLFLLLLWSGFVFWFFTQHSKALVGHIKEKLQKDRPLVAYQQLTIEPQRDKEKSALLRFMATEYANEDVSLEAVATKLGISRNKINDILKEELGYTFTAYLNKLRLTEAARLLSADNDANVAEIAYSVGYKNVPYFNKLFKIEYGCTPKVFKNNYKGRCLNS